MPLTLVMDQGNVHMDGSWKADGVDGLMYMGDPTNPSDDGLSYPGGVPTISGYFYNPGSISGTVEFQLYRSNTTTDPCYTASSTDYKCFHGYAYYGSTSAWWNGYLEPQGTISSPPATPTANVPWEGVWYTDFQDVTQTTWYYNVPMPMVMDGGNVKMDCSWPAAGPNGICLTGNVAYSSDSGISGDTISGSWWDAYRSHSGGFSFTKYHTTSGACAPTTAYPDPCFTGTWSYDGINDRPWNGWRSPQPH